METIKINHNSDHLAIIKRISVFCDAYIRNHKDYENELFRIGINSDCFREDLAEYEHAMDLFDKLSEKRSDIMYWIEDYIMLASGSFALEIDKYSEFVAHNEDVCLISALFRLLQINYEYKLNKDNTAFFIINEHLLNEGGNI